jgi:UDP-GlcNAc:undecaprenyl-phosphate GlcNAc-1-phosphate transferase
VSELDALWAFLVALAVAALVTPVVARLAVRVGAVDEPRERGLAARSTPLLGGLAILAGVLVAAAIWLPVDQQTTGIMLGAATIALLGALDDVFELGPGVKLVGQVVAALIPVVAGVRVENVTLPFVGALEFHAVGGGILTVIGLVGLMNVVNFSDGVDGLAAGVCAISAVAFSIIAFDLGRTGAGVLAAIVAGAALGFLIHNFHPASVFMGDCGALLLGLLLGCVAVQGSLKTNALIALVGPLAILAVPFLDTSFVIARRLKHGVAPWSADANHFHHRFARIGFSQRRTVLYLYAWTFALAGLALALRFVPYSDNHGHFRLGWSLVLAGLGLLVLAASVYLVIVLEILKLKRLRAWQLRRADPTTSEHEIQAQLEHELETGEFPAVAIPPRPDGADAHGPDVPAAPVPPAQRGRP